MKFHILEFVWCTKCPNHGFIFLDTCLQFWWNLGVVHQLPLTTVSSVIGSNANEPNAYLTATSAPDHIHWGDHPSSALVQPWRKHRGFQKGAEILLAAKYCVQEHTESPRDAIKIHLEVPQSMYSRNFLGMLCKHILRFLWNDTTSQLKLSQVLSSKKCWLKSP